MTDMTREDFFWILKGIKGTGKKIKLSTGAVIQSNEDGTFNAYEGYGHYTVDAPSVESETLANLVDGFDLRNVSKICDEI